MVINYRRLWMADWDDAICTFNQLLINHIQFKIWYSIINLLQRLLPRVQCKKMRPSVCLSAHTHLSPSLWLVKLQLKFQKTCRFFVVHLISSCVDNVHYMDNIWDEKSTREPCEALLYVYQCSDATSFSECSKCDLSHT